MAANVKTPFASILNGPVVTGVTSVLAPVTGLLFKVSFVVTFSTTVGILPVATLTAGSFTASIGFETTTIAVAVSQFDGTTFKPVAGFASHNW